MDKFKKGDRVTIHNNQLCLPTGGVVMCAAKDFAPDVYVIGVDVEYYGFNFLLLHEKFLKIAPP